MTPGVNRFRLSGASLGVKREDPVRWWSIRWQIEYPGRSADLAQTIGDGRGKSVELPLLGSSEWGLGITIESERNDVSPVPLPERLDTRRTAGGWFADHFGHHRPLGFGYQIVESNSV